MRQAWIKALTEQCEKKDNIYLLSGDLGYNLFEPFIARFPKKFINCGIAEQNMIGIAAGLAIEGNTVFVYSLANFSTLRCLEQIRNDVCYHDLDVKIVSYGGGLGYGNLGMSHHNTEDIAIMRALPNMTVIAPGNSDETYQVTNTVIEYKHPCYLRLSKAEDWTELINLKFDLGNQQRIFKGKDLTIFTTGNMINVGIDVCNKLDEIKISAELYHVSTIKPLINFNPAYFFTKMVTLEDHSVIGGLGGAIAEEITKYNGGKLLRLGIPDTFYSVAGDVDYLRDLAGLSVLKIVKSIKRFINE